MFEECQLEEVLPDALHLWLKTELARVPSRTILEEMQS
jgi:hypothetical protein